MTYIRDVTVSNQTTVCLPRFVGLIKAISPITQPLNSLEVVYKAQIYVNVAHVHVPSRPWNIFNGIRMHEVI